MKYKILCYWLPFYSLYACTMESTQNVKRKNTIVTHSNLIDKNQYDLNNILESNLESRKKLQELLKKSKELEETISLYEHQALLFKKDCITELLESASNAYQHANALTWTTPNSIQISQVHISYANKFISKANELLLQYEKILTLKAIPRKSRL